MTHPSLGVPRRILVHHTASARTTTFEEVERWHHERRWRAIGYHYFIPVNGLARIGRPLPELGAHCKNFNPASIGICVAGDNTKPEHRWSLRQVESLKALIRHIVEVWPFIANDIYGHRDFGETKCPGLDVRALLAGSLVVG